MHISKGGRHPALQRHGGTGWGLIVGINASLMSSDLSTETPSHDCHAILQAVDNTFDRHS